MDLCGSSQQLADPVAPAMSSRPNEMENEGQSLVFPAVGKSGGPAHKTDKSGTAVLIDAEGDAVGESGSEPLLVHLVRSGAAGCSHQRSD